MWLLTTRSPVRTRLGEFLFAPTPRKNLAPRPPHQRQRQRPHHPSPRIRHPTGYPKRGSPFPLTLWNARTKLDPTDAYRYQPRRTPAADRTSLDCPARLRGSTGRTQRTHGRAHETQGRAHEPSEPPRPSTIPTTARVRCERYNGRRAAKVA